ncbi:oligosaccharyl transferase subunit ost3/OST6 [Orbilia oligospora]|uniref:Oligosaccharyl transferase subunit ost3/OST6 n=1 Tax=Orbilia oligospora TaxID=2813651 RepID=A0A7C8PPS7_ORBOL|nr:oligosaccharyl transferase subunit ost3/OST6 [Orbilia oligospora]KAF3186591.1 oligosaccharyl transferase subunit ost3/OST6 [Orbilia oligospora]KAF3246269.1 oligosaccharyl transferase subunit ost3/OST6 [Orbilia oligospora]KAF3266072.1 oligosaccharyl transferase subunit ost3/OST6 [Orbilia oligospora]KAF3296744.1 oligosaccharyl transferase subunit ost3/OST6 [Orbilia oligospora]
MRLLPLLTAFTSLFSLTVAQKSTNKHQTFADLASSSKGSKGVVLLNDQLFGDLTGPNRNFTSVVLFTALDARFGCVLCRDFQPEFDLLGNSWHKEHPKSDGLFFTILDFSVGKQTFQRLGMSTAPILMLFPSSNAGPGSDQPIKFDFNPSDITPAEAVARWVTTHTKHTVTIHRPFNYVKLFSFIGGIIGTATLSKLAYPYLAPALFSRNLWAAISLVSVLLFTSGHMFNHIRKVPYVVQGRGGGVSYIAGGFSNQLGLETQIVAVVYAVLAFSSIALCLKMPRMESSGKQKIAVMAWNLVLLVLFSFLMSIFKMKNGAYPFFLPPLIA